jgi:hypothetical protein
VGQEPRQRGGDAPTTFNPEIIYGTRVANRFDVAADRGNMAGTRRNRFLLSAMYDLPVGQNRKFGSNLNRLADLAIGGWSISTVILWQTGASSSEHSSVAWRLSLRRTLGRCRLRRL